MTTSTSIKSDDGSLLDSNQTSTSLIKDISRDENRSDFEKLEQSIVSTEDIENNLSSTSPAVEKAPSVISLDQQLSTDQEKDKTIFKTSSIPSTTITTTSTTDHQSVIEPSSSSIELKNIPEHEQQEQQQQPVIEHQISTHTEDSVTQSENANRQIE